MHEVQWCVPRSSRHSDPGRTTRQWPVGATMHRLAQRQRCRLRRAGIRHPGDAAYGLPHGYLQPLTGAFREAQRLWKVESGDIELASMHRGTVLQDRPPLMRLLVVSVQWLAVSTSPF